MDSAPRFGGDELDERERRTMFDSFRVRMLFDKDFRGSVKAVEEVALDDNPIARYDTDEEKEDHRIEFLRSWQHLIDTGMVFFCEEFVVDFALYLIKIGDCTTPKEVS